MQLTLKALKQLINHDGVRCTPNDNFLEEAVHFLYYHRWWPTSLIVDNLTGTNKKRREVFVSLALCLPFSCGSKIPYANSSRPAIHSPTAPETEREQGT